MNADPAETRSPHLDLSDLIAGAAGQPVGDRAREHLASCEHCQREANRWNLVADGVRDLAATAPETAQPARPRRTGRPVPTGPWRRAVLVAGSAAAALVLLAGVGEVTGVVHVRFGNNGTETILTAVTGCSQIEQADGTLEQANGNSLVIKTASGQPVTVTTTATTFMSMSGPLLSDITDGASVMVRGARSGGTITAAIVTVGQPFSAVDPPGFAPVQGTVADAGTGGFTLVTSSGARIPVITSGDTLVVIPHASPGQLQAGAPIVAVGHAGSDGTLAARAVAAVSQLPSGGAHPHIGKGKGLLAQLDRGGARRDQRNAHLRRLIRQTPMMAGTAPHAVPATACTNRGAPLIPVASRVPDVDPGRDGTAHQCVRPRPTGPAASRHRLRQTQSARTTAAHGQTESDLSPGP